MRVGDRISVDGGLHFRMGRVSINEKKRGQIASHSVRQSPWEWISYSLSAVRWGRVPNKVETLPSARTQAPCRYALFRPIQAQYGSFERLGGLREKRVFFGRQSRQPVWPGLWLAGVGFHKAEQSVDWPATRGSKVEITSSEIELDEASDASCKTGCCPPQQPGETLRRSGPKVGRNDPCPCDSGRKFKKCCGS